MARLVVIWRNVYWEADGSHHGWVPGHMNHCHSEMVGAGAEDEIIVVGRWYERHGARPGEHPLWGGVHPVHSGRGHYEHRAVDVNFGPGGENQIEKSFFDSWIPQYVHGSTPVSFFMGGTIPPVPEVSDADLLVAVKTILDRLDQIDRRLDLDQHDTAERIARVVKYVKANTAQDKAQAEAILAELERTD